MHNVGQDLFSEEGKFQNPMYSAIPIMFKKKIITDQMIREYLETYTRNFYKKMLENTFDKVRQGFLSFKSNHCKKKKK